MSASGPNVQTWESVTYPDPHYVYSKFDLGVKPDAPDDFLVCGETHAACASSRRLKKSSTKLLTDFYFWGIEPRWGSRPNNPLMIKTLWKLFYYQAPMHRPTTWAELVDLTRDAGPRTIDYTHSSFGTLVPVSRHYPNAPNPFRTISPNYVRPPNASNEWPDLYLEQFLFPSDGNPTLAPNLNTVNVNNLQAADNDGNDGDGSAMDVDNDGDISVRTATPTSVFRGFQTPTYTPNKQAQNMINTAARAYRGAQLPDHISRKVTEAVERAVMQFAYTDLERHHTAAPLDPPRNVTATAATDILRTTIASFPAASRVRLTPGAFYSRMTINPDGQFYPIRGRGPTVGDGSGAIECVITVGKLLDIGSTNIDRRSNDWHTKLTAASQAFIELADVDWDICTAETATRLKVHFQALLSISSPTFQEQSPNAVSLLWNAVASQFDQFRLSFEERTTPCTCTMGPDSTGHFNTFYVSPPFQDQDQHGVTMQELLSRTFEPKHTKACNVCGQPDTTPYVRAFEDLPLRLVVKVHDGASIWNHTKDITVTYRNLQGENETAAYRWLGGIYRSHNGNHRVFWSDALRGEEEKGRIRMYDGSNLGIIVGGIPPTNKDDRVPGDWWMNKPVPILIYERVLNPSHDVLGVALRAASNMLRMKTRDELILQGHAAWPPSIVSRPAVGYPWQQQYQLLPPDAQRFHLADGPYNPQGSRTNRPNNNAVNNNNIVTAENPTTTFNQPPATQRRASDAVIPPLPSVGSSPSAVFAVLAPGVPVFRAQSLRSTPTQTTAVTATQITATTTAATPAIGSPSGLSTGVFSGLDLVARPAQIPMLEPPVIDPGQAFDVPTAPATGPATDPTAHLDAAPATETALVPTIEDDNDLFVPAGSPTPPAAQPQGTGQASPGEDQQLVLANAPAEDFDAIPDAFMFDDNQLTLSTPGAFAASLVTPTHEGWRGRAGNNNSNSGVFDLPEGALDAGPLNIDMDEAIANFFSLPLSRSHSRSDTRDDDNDETITVSASRGSDSQTTLLTFNKTGLKKALKRVMNELDNEGSSQSPQKKASTRNPALTTRVTKPNSSRRNPPRK